MAADKAPESAESRGRCAVCGEPLSASERQQEFRVHLACIPRAEDRSATVSESAAAWLEAQPPDPTANGYVTEVGERVWCTRVSDGKRIEGRVDENRLGLFLHTDDGQAVVLTASLWAVGPLPPLRTVPNGR